jgi:hypothetical protein
MTRLRYLDTRKACAKCARSVLFEEIGIMDMIGQYDTIRKCWSSPAAVPGHLFSKMRTTRSFRKVPTMRHTQRIEQVHEHGLPEVMHVRMARRQPRGTRHTATHNIPFVLMKNLGPSQCRAVLPNTPGDLPQVRTNVRVWFLGHSSLVSWNYEVCFLNMFFKPTY